MAEAGGARQRLIGRANTLALALLVGAALGIILLLVVDVQRRLDALARASSDSVQWSLAQLEIETQRLEESLVIPGVTLDEVRKRFDIFFSRVMIFESSPLYADLRDRSDFSGSLAKVGGFIEAGLPVFDGPDPQLRQALPRLGRETRGLRPAIRSMALAGIDYFSAESDRQRREMALTLRRVATMTGLLIVALSVLSIGLLRLYQRGRAQARDNRLTTARLETVVGTSVDAIVVVDATGKVLEFNAAAETIFGYTRAEATGALITALILPDGAVAETIATIRSQLFSAEARLAGRQRIEIEAVRKDRSRFPVELSVASAENADGEIFVAFLRDISDRRQIEHDLTEARDLALKGEKTKAEFLAVMSHEMRTPLNGLLGSVELLGASTLDARQSEMLDVIETSGKVLLHHVNSVLDISTAEAGAIRIERTPFVLEALVREVVANQNGLAAAAGSRIEIVGVAEQAGLLLGDPARLRQILLNLVGNAVKFTRDGTIRVEIEAEPPQGDTRMVEIRVVDSGIGIAEADQERVFDDFVTLDSSYGRPGGTGLGLGITRRLVRALGGTIGMESEPGAGSVFWVRLPMSIAIEGQPDAGQAPAAALGKAGFSVLIIEDNPINRFVLRSLLEEVDHRVTEAVDGIEGVAAADAKRHDVILMDISMPRLDGIEAARRIRAGGGPSSGARIIAVTAHALPEEIDCFHAAGIDDCLVKPVTRGTLAQVLSGRPAPVVAGFAEVAGLPLIDRALIDDLLARLDRTTGGALLRRFVQEADEIVPAILAGPADEATERLRHRLAGSAATFGARRLAEMLRIMASRSDASAGIGASLGTTWRETRADLLGLCPDLAATLG